MISEIRAVKDCIQICVKNTLHLLVIMQGHLVGKLYEVDNEGNHRKTQNEDHQDPLLNRYTAQLLSFLAAINVKNNGENDRCQHR